MNCRMCYIHMDEKEIRERGRERTAQEWIEMGKACARSGMLFLLLTGGEPFLRSDFREIYTELKKLGLLITINTNGTLIDEETVEWLKKDPPIMMNITLYGEKEETYERLCGYKGGYARTVKAIEMLTEAGIQVSINVSLTRCNEKDREGILRFAIERELPFRIASYMFPPVRNAKNGKTDDEVRFTAAESAKARYECLRQQVGEETFAKMKEAFRKGKMIPAEPLDDCIRSSTEKMGCMAGRGSFWITWDGRMTPCGMMNDPAVRPFETGFEKSWKQLVKEAGKICLPPECGKCEARPVCMVCGALSKAEGNGDSMKRPQYLCEISKEYIRLMQES